MKIVLLDGAFMPRRAHPTDAGLDLMSREDKKVPAHGSAVFDTGVCVELPKGTAGLLVAKSGLNVRHNITSTGLIDEGYTGSIKVKLFNHGNIAYAVNRGDKISQLVIVPVLASDPEAVDTLHPTERGDGGFGSTGR